jgi:hypothetical protein
MPFQGNFFGFNFLDVFVCPNAGPLSRKLPMRVSEKLAYIKSMNPTVIQAIFGPAFLIMGLSHLLQPKLWVRFFEVVKQSGVAAIIIPMYTLPFGLVLIATHNIWRWDWPLFLTIAGWGMTIKSAAYLLVPTLADRMLAKKMATTPRSYQIVGAISAIFGAIITWQAWTKL